jgi:hypothetical protein
MKYFLIITILLFSINANAISYECSVTKKFDSKKEYSLEEIKKFNFKLKISENNKQVISRCSLSISENKNTCDEYEVDRIEVDKIAKIQKYYVFKNQFDVQLYSDLTFLENNGRGGISFGKCKNLN